MKTLREIVASYDTDKIGYVPVYEELLESRRESVHSVLELDIYHGGSIAAWHDYFPSAVICGVDLNEAIPPVQSERIKLYQGSQDDARLLDQIASENSPGGFDLVIDDAAHIGFIARHSFQHIFRNLLKGGGIYCIEDWGTGYWQDWPDGVAYENPNVTPEGRIESHNFGMVGLIKEIVDHVGQESIHKYSPDAQLLPISRITVTPGLALIIKSTT